MRVEQLTSYISLMTFAFLCALVVVYVLTPGIIRLGFRLGFVDQPDERRIHDTPTPRIGGLGVWIGFIFTVYLLSCSGIFPVSLAEESHWTYAVFLTTLPLLVVGLIDDRWEISPLIKLFGQIGVGVFAWQQGLNLDKMLGLDMPVMVDLVATTFLYVAAMNAYNLIDGMDGVAAGLAAVTSLGLSGLNLLLGSNSMAALCLALTGACLGFLRYNFHPARIFLGDTGSMLLGFLLIALTLNSQARTTAAIMLIVPILTMGIPLIDTGLAIWRRSVRRAINGEAGGLSRADKDHIHHRLARRGLTQRRVAILLYTLQAAIFGFGILYIFVQSYRLAIFVVAFFAGSYVGLRYLASLEMSDSGRWIVDGIRRPGRMQLFNSLLPAADVFCLSFALVVLSWLFHGENPQLSLGRLLRESGALIVGGPLILLWATHYYRVHWIRARTFEFFTFGLITTAGLMIGFALSALPLHLSFKENVHISLLLMSLTVPPMTLIRSLPRLVQDFLHYYERKTSFPNDASGRKVLVYGAGFGFSLITRSESFADSSQRQNYQLIGLIDDDPHLRGRLVNGHTVLGDGDEIDSLVRTHQVSEIIISTDLHPEKKQKLLELADTLNLRITQSLFRETILRE